MKLINLIPLKEDYVDPVEVTTNPDILATPFFRQFHTAHGYKPMFKYLGTKGEEMIFSADVKNFGEMDLIVKDAQIIAKVSEKEAIFGMVYTLTGLEKFDATICKMKMKDGKIESIMFDDKDKKNFGAAATKFMDLIQKAK